MMIARVPLVAMGGWRDLIRRIGAPSFKMSRCFGIPDNSMELTNSVTNDVFFIVYDIIVDVYIWGSCLGRLRWRCWKVSGIYGYNLLAFLRGTFTDIVWRYHMVHGSSVQLRIFVENRDLRWDNIIDVVRSDSSICWEPNHKIHMR